jgi:large subunit ribosomal protein L30
MAEKTEKTEGILLLAVRVRGSVGVSHDINMAMRSMCLTRRHHAALLPKNPSTLGTLQKSKDYLTWGEVSEATLEKLLAARARLAGDRKLSDEWLAKNAGHNTIASLAKALFEGRTSFNALHSLGVKPLFRLHSPVKGFGRIKEHFPRGALGYRGAAINELVERML